MKNAQVKILEVQPHNIFLAEEALAFLRRQYPHFQPVEIIRYRGKLYSNDGDHRLFTAFRQGRQHITAEICNFDGRIDLAGYIARKHEQRILELAGTLKGGRETVEAMYKMPGPEETIAHLLDTAAFVRSGFKMGNKEYLGVFSVEGLEGRILPTKNEVGICYENVRREWGYERRKSMGR